MTANLNLSDTCFGGILTYFTRYEIMLSTRPEKSVGTDAIWELATEGLKGALERKGWDYTVRLG